MSGIEYHNTVDNSATIVDSTVKNMLNASEDGENTAVYPLPGENESNAYIPPRTESYETEITNENCFIELPHQIERLIKVEAYCQNTSAEARYYTDATKYVYEFSQWTTLPTRGVSVNLTIPYRESRLYYRIGDKRIENLNGDLIGSLLGLSLIHI